MDKKEHTESTISKRLKPAKYEHLKPLSVYSRMITCNQKDSVQQFCKPFINFKIEVINNCWNKRKLDDSSSDDGYVSPAKKAFSPKALSPNLQCFMDSCSPPAKLNSESALLNNAQAVMSEIQQTVCSQLHSEHVEGGSLAKPGDNEGTVSHSVKCENVFLNVAPAFDCDVDRILCLTPFGCSTAGGFSDDAESCKSPSCNTFQNKAVYIPTVAQDQDLKKGDGKMEEEQEELKKEVYLDVKDEEEDKGYFSMSYIKDLKIEKSLSQSVNLQRPPATSSPLLKIVEVEAPKDECHAGRFEPNCHKQAALSGQHVSFTVGLSPVVSGLPSVNSPVEPLECDIEEGWDIGLPIFESSVCHNVIVNFNAGSEQSRQVSEEVQPIHECQVSLGGEETTLDTSCETTLPLQVQVKSVVVGPTQHPSSSKPAVPPMPKQNAKITKPSPKENKVSQTPNCSSNTREVDLERDKQMYLNLVTRHLNENAGGEGDKGVMTELLNLMTHVADQSPGTNGKQWQHPSDLTRRNYQRRFGNMMPTMALHEWQAKNCTTYKRFAKVPKFFQRSQCP